MGINLDDKGLADWDDLIAFDNVLGVLEQLHEEVLEIQNDHVRLAALNEILDGRVKRALEGERQKLDPWGNWMNSSLLDTAKPGEHENHETRKHVETWEEANVLYSKVSSDDDLDEAHVVALDIDLPIRVVPSTHPGRGHLWIKKNLDWGQVVQLLDVLVDVGIVSKSYREHSIQRGYTCLRPAFVEKKPWSPSSDTCEEHKTDGTPCPCNPEVVFVEDEK